MTKVIDLAVHQPPDAEALIEEARRHKRRRHVWIGSLLVVFVVLSLSFYALAARSAGPQSRTQSPRPSTLLDVHTSATLVWALDTLHVINADTGLSRTLPMPAPQGAYDDGQMLSAQGSLLLTRGERAWLYPPGLTHPPLDLGPSGGITLASSGDRVWLWDPGPPNDLVNGGVRLVDFTGHQVSPPVAVPAPWIPSGEAFDQGLVLVRLPCVCAPEVWDPTSSRVVRSFPPDGAEVAANGHLRAWIDSGCRFRCVLHVTDLGTGADRAIAFLSGGSWSGPNGGAFSPDGTTLAFTELLGHFTAVRGDGHRADERFAQTAEVVVVVDLAKGTARVLPGSDRSTTVQRAFPLTWSSNGWLFFTDYGSKEVRAWHPGMRTAGILPKVRLPSLPAPGPHGQRLPTLIAL